MSKKTITAYEAEMTQLEAAIRATATMVTGDPDLTDEGKKRRHHGWAKERRWAEQFDATANGMLDALNAAQDKAASVRATMTTLPVGADALAQEQRLNRRRKRIDSALNAGGTGPLVDLIAGADDAELPFIIEYVNDHYESVGGDLGSAGAQIVEQSLRQRSDEYDQAAHVAGAAGNALTIAREKIEYMSKLIEDPATPPPGEYSLAGMSVTGVVPAVADLTA